MDYLHYFYLLFVVANYSFLESCASVAYVKSHDYNVTCPNVTDPCLTLREYAEEEKQYFTSNSSLIFLPGTHELDTSIYFVNVSNFSLATYAFERDDMTKVIISSSGNIKWTNCNNVTVFGLLFIMNGDSITKRSSGLALIKTNGLLSNLTVRHTHRAGSVTNIISSSDIKISDLTVCGTGRAGENAFYILNSTVDFSGENGFYYSFAQNLRGTMFLDESTITFSGKNVFLHNRVSCALFGTSGGGALVSISSTLIFSGSVSFYNNTAAVGDYCNAGGGAILASDSTIIFNSISDVVFDANAAPTGGAIFMYNSSLKIEENATVMFQFNAANLEGSGSGGAIICGHQSEIWSNGKSVIFRKNYATSMGGAIFTESSIAKLVNVTFEENEADVGGAFCRFNYDRDGLYLHNISSCEFLNNTVSFAGGAVGVLYTRETVFGGGNSFKYNSAWGVGGAIVVMYSDVTFSGANNFINNSAHLGGSIQVVSSNSSESVNMIGNQTFIGNVAEEGGAIAFTGRAKLLLTEPIQVNFIQNQANTKGGAIICHTDLQNSISGCDTIGTKTYGLIQLSKQDCFIEFINTSSLFLSRIQFHFVNNTAGRAGSVLYGGGLDQCKVSVGDGATDICGNRIARINFADPLQLIKTISSIVSDDNVTSHISSDPRRICICAHNDLVCNYTHKKEIQTVRGKEFTMNVVAIGLGGGVVPSNILISPSNDFRIGANQRIQWAGKKCTPIAYQLFSEKNSTTLVLYPEGPCRDTGQSGWEIIVNFLPCPEGFSLEGSSCVCEERLQQYTTECSVSDNSIRRQANTFWMGVSYDNASYEGLILHSGCPFDYCTHKPVLITLDNMDIQCNHNHTGMLCGACRINYSIALGTLHCLPCSNHYLALILPFAVAGVALITVLLLLKLSVADGTLNGIIFYANVIQANRSAFFLPGKTDILTVFIAWLNLDLGIETCFYDGMTAYAFTWLQFLFPFYIWLLMALIIVMSRFSGKITKIFGTNPITALATLFLLSYSKILRTVITVLSATSLEYPGDIHRKVWLYDGHVPYFQRLDHILLGTFTIMVLLLLFLPYTILLLFGPCFQAYSHLRIFSWINRIKPFMDAYYAPYKKHTQYWTGLLLLLRCILFLVFGLNTFANANFNLLIITSATAGLTAVAWIHKHLYEKQLNNVLEACSIINLCIFSASTYHARITGGDQTRLAYASVSITFITFICIAIQKVYLLIHKRFKLPGLSDLRNYVNKVMRSDRGTDTNQEIATNRNEHSFKPPTLIVVELDEPLLYQ